MRGVCDRHAIALSYWRDLAAKSKVQDTVWRMSRWTHTDLTGPFSARKVDKCATSVVFLEKQSGLFLDTTIQLADWLARHCWCTQHCQTCTRRLRWRTLPLAASSGFPGAFLRGSSGRPHQIS